MLSIIGVSIQREKKNVQLYNNSSKNEYSFRFI
jgi:hypothetical protein